jgi:nucleolar protein 12
MSTVNSDPLRHFNKLSCVQISTKPNPAPTKTGAKRRGDATENAFPAPFKRKKSVNAQDLEQPSLQPISRTNATASHPKRTREGKAHRVSKRTAKTEKTHEASDDEVHAGLEEAYEHKVHPGKQVAGGSSRDSEQLSDTSDSEGDASQLAHETVVKKAKRDRIRSKHVHHVPPDETREQRDSRTIFLGNVPMEVAKSKVCLTFLSWPLFSPIVSLP